MTKIFNGTAHPIVIVKDATFAPAIRKWVGGDVSMMLPMNGPLNAKIDTIDGTPIDGIPTFGKKIWNLEPLPDGYDIYVVSSIYATAAKMFWGDKVADKMYTIADPVYSDDGTSIRGCRGICPAF